MGSDREDGSDERRSDPFEPSRGVGALGMPSVRLPLWTSARLPACPSASRACPSSFSFSFSPSDRFVVEEIPDLVRGTHYRRARRCACAHVMFYSFDIVPWVHHRLRARWEASWARRSWSKTLFGKKDAFRLPSATYGTNCLRTNVEDGKLFSE